MLKHERAVEAAARAICCPDGCLHARENGIFCSRPHYQEKARAAIAAFLEAVEPSEEMTEVLMGNAREQFRFQATAGGYSQTWVDGMVDATRADIRKKLRAMSKALAEELRGAALRARAAGEG